MPLSAYEKLRNENIKRNQLLLAKLGLKVRNFADSIAFTHERTAVSIGAANVLIRYLHTFCAVPQPANAAKSASAALAKKAKDLKRKHAFEAARAKKKAKAKAKAAQQPTRRSSRARTAAFSPGAGFRGLGAGASPAIGRRSLRSSGTYSPAAGGRQLRARPKPKAAQPFSPAPKAKRPQQKYQQVRQNQFGDKGLSPIGTTWDYRIECAASGIHRYTVAGIHGSETEGCYSVALSGGYEDDVDAGTHFTYTGEGGRDLKGTPANRKNLRTAPQSKPQTLTRGNLALKISCDTGKPVRVIRGYKLDSPFAPATGYRYDVLYQVKSFSFVPGMAGKGVYKYAFVRMPGQKKPWV